LSFVSIQNVFGSEASTKVQSTDAKRTENTTREPFGKVNHDEKKIVKPQSDNRNLDQKIAHLKELVQKNPKDYSKTIELAYAYFEKSDLEKTTAILWSQIDHLDRKAILMLAKAHEQRKEHAEAIKALEILVGKSENDFEALSLLGGEFSLIKNKKEAVLENYKKAIEINPKYEPAYLGLADFFEKRNPPNLTELRILFQDMIASIGPHPKYLQKICDINAKDEGTIEAAIETCRQATISDPSTADGFVNLGLSLKVSGKTEEGLAAIKKAALSFPKSELAQFTYGKALEGNKNSVDAMKYYKAGTESEPTSARSWLGLASTTFELKKYETAYEAFKKACRFDKKNAVAFRRATAVLRTNKVTDWIEKFESSSESCNF
jgi:tetratricopeptide (TPR) repeat protein